MFDPDFTPSSSNPVLSIARHHDIDINMAYGFADLVLRTHQAGDKVQMGSYIHTEAIVYFNTVEQGTLIQNLIQEHVLKYRGVTVDD